MQTTIQLTAKELPDFVAALQTLFKKEKVVEITVSPVHAISLEKKETREEYWAKLKKRLKNLDEGKNIVEFTGEEFERYVAEGSVKYGKRK